MASYLVLVCFSCRLWKAACRWWNC